MPPRLVVVNVVVVSWKSSFGVCICRGEDKIAAHSILLLVGSDSRN